MKKILCLLLTLLLIGGMSSSVLAADNSQTGVEQPQGYVTGVSQPVAFAQKKLTLTAGKSVTLRVAAESASGYERTVKFSLDRKSGKGVVRLNAKTGKLTALKPGTAIVWAHRSEAVTDKAKLTIKVLPKGKAVAIRKVTARVPKSMEVGNVASISRLKCSPSNATNAYFTFKSSKSTVATVNAAGRIVAINAGTTRITVQAGNRKAVYTLKVTDSSGAGPYPVKGWYNAGTYEVGRDIPAGEYLLEGQYNLSGFTSSYIELNKTAGGDTILNDTFENRRYLKVEEGQFLKVERARFIQAAKVPPYRVKKGVWPSGMYKVGHDIAPGDYRITASATDRCVVKITESPNVAPGAVGTRSQHKIIMAGKSAVFTVRDGDYLQMQWRQGTMQKA